MDNIKVGDIHVRCWGYSMTLYDFYEVVKVTDKSIKYRKMSKQCVQNKDGDIDSWMPSVRPTTVNMSEPAFTKRARIGYDYDPSSTYEENHWD